MIHAPHRATSSSCGPTGPTTGAAAAGGGLVALGEQEFRMKSSKVKADQMKASEAAIITTACENCHTQLTDLNAALRPGDEGGVPLQARRRRAGEIGPARLRPAVDAAVRRGNSAVSRAAASSSSACGLHPRNVSRRVRQAADQQPVEEREPVVVHLAARAGRAQTSGPGASPGKTDCICMSASSPW